MRMNKTLIVCDVQPDVVKKLALPEQRLFCDLVNLAVEAARLGGLRILYTQLYFENGNYDCIPPIHPKLGILRKLPNATWFTMPDLCVAVNEEMRVKRRHQADEGTSLW